MKDNPETIKEDDTSNLPNDETSMKEEKNEVNLGKLTKVNMLENQCDNSVTDGTKHSVKPQNILQNLEIKINGKDEGRRNDEHDVSDNKMITTDENQEAHLDTSSEVDNIETECAFPKSKLTNKKKTKNT